MKIVGNIIGWILIVVVAVFVFTLILGPDTPVTGQYVKWPTFNMQEVQGQATAATFQAAYDSAKIDLDSKVSGAAPDSSQIRLAYAKRIETRERVRRRMETVVKYDVVLKASLPENQQ